MASALETSNERGQGSALGFSICGAGVQDRLDDEQRTLDLLVVHLVDEQMQLLTGSHGSVVPALRDMRGDVAVRCADADYESTIIGMS